MSAASAGVGASGATPAGVLSPAYQFFLDLPIADPRTLVPCYLAIPEPEQAALFRDELLTRGLDAAELESAARVYQAPVGRRTDAVIRLAECAVQAEELTRRYADAPEPEWLVPGYLPSVGLVLLASRPKRGKTLLAEHLAVEVARGGEWLGFSLPQGPAVIIQADQGWRSTARRLAMWGVDGLPLTVLARRGLRLSAIDRLAEDLARLRPKLVVLDAAAVLLDLSSESDNQAVARELSVLTALADRLNAAILLIHHNRKAERADEALVSVRGGTAWVGAADVILELLPAADGRLHLRATPRDDESPPPIILELDTQRLIWRSLGTADELQQRGADEPRQRGAEEEILAMIGLLGDRATTTAIAGRLGAERKTVEQRLNDLLRQGRLEVCTGEANGPGRPAQSWRIAE